MILLGMALGNGGGNLYMIGPVYFFLNSSMVFTNKESNIDSECTGESKDFLMRK